jgi:single-strand DNA-binding protein
MMKLSNAKGVDVLINQVTLVGRLTRNPELKSTAEGTSVTQIILAVNRNFRNHHGEIDTDFVQCTLWRKAAENTCYYCRKGSLLGITGRLQTRHYDNREGKRIYVTEVVAETVRFLSSRPQTPPATLETQTAPAAVHEAPVASRTAPAESQAAPAATAAVGAETQTVNDTTRAQLVSERAFGDTAGAQTASAASNAVTVETQTTAPAASQTDQRETYAKPAAAVSAKKEEEYAF